MLAWIKINLWYIKAPVFERHTQTHLPLLCCPRFGHFCSDSAKHTQPLLFSSYTTSAFSFISVLLCVSVCLFSPLSRCLFIHQLFRDHVAGVPQLQGESNNNVPMVLSLVRYEDPLASKRSVIPGESCLYLLEFPFIIMLASRPILAFKSPYWL